MAQNLDLNININTKGSEVIGVIRKELKEANGELLKAQTLYGDYSKEAVAAAQKVAELRDKISEARETSDLFDPGKKFQAFSGVLTTVAGGLSAVQGAMGLLGAESEDVQKALLKVQSAMALSQGLSTIKDSAKDFARLGTIIKSTTLFQQAYNFVLGQKVVVTQADVIATEAQTVATVEQGAATVATTTAVTGATTAMKAFRVALIASGIGLLIVAIGLAVQAFSNYVGAAAKAEEAQNKLNKKIADGAKIALDAEQKFLEGQEKLDLARAKAKGASEQEIFEIEQKYRRLRVESHQRHYQEVYGKDAKAAEESSAEINKINTDGQIAAFDNEARIRKENQEKKEREEKEAADKLQKDLLKSYEDYLKRREFARKNSEGIYIDDIRKFEQEDAEERDKKRNEEIDKNVIAQNKAIANIKLTGVQILAIDQANSDARAKIDKDFKEAQLEAEYELQDAKFAAVSAGFNLLATLAGKNERLANVLFIADRALAIAQVVINAQREIAANNANPTWSLLPDGGAVIKKAANIAARIRAGVGIATIAATTIAKFKSGGGGGGGGGVQDGGGSSAQAPMLPQLPQAQTTNISRQSINDLGNQAVRAYVIETDVTGNQQRMAAIRQRARFS
jgi:hypothetical protein